MGKAREDKTQLADFSNVAISIRPNLSNVAISICPNLSKIAILIRPNELVELLSQGIQEEEDERKREPS